MYRARVIAQVKFGRFKDYTEICGKINDIAKARGWAESTIWVTSFGTANQVIIETEYPDLATLQREEEAFNSDEEARALIGGAVDCLVEGRTELIQTVPTFA
jgi:hypothetical protein